MKNFLILISFTIFSNCFCQTIDDLKQTLFDYISKKNLEAGISIQEIEGVEKLNINEKMEAPMMSIFKFHIGLAILDLVDQKKLKLNQKFFIKKEELLPNTWSPIRDEFPEGNIELSLKKILIYTVSHSDNNGADILIRILGGTEVVQNFIRKQGIEDFKMEVNEEEMQNWENLYRNTTTPLASTEILQKFFEGKILKKKSTKLMYEMMVDNSRGQNWLKAGLPNEIEFAHRTGISSTNAENIRAGMNNIGIVKLPNGKHYIISIFLKDVKEDLKSSEKILAELSRMTWNYFHSKYKN
jgi:beta-lactamase class A